ncbi:MAG: helix-turn-helix domain-containing protein [Desulfobacterales bacterium]|nr:helix-turn-helix domain-containing protein [Desulfobacterales bacterium]
MDNLLTAKQTAKLLNVSVPLIYRMADRGQLPCICWDCPGEGKKRVRNTVRFDLAEIMDFIDKHRKGLQ